MADTTTTPRDETNSDEIRRDIRRTRTGMDETVDALTERLSPGSIMDEVWQRVRNGDGLTSVVRDHPVPLALMGLGLGWLAIEQARGSAPASDVGPGTHARAEGRKGPYRGEAVGKDDSDWEHTNASTRAKSMMSDAASRAGEKVSEAASAASRAGGQAARSTNAGFWNLLQDQPLAMGALAFGLGLAGGLAIPSTDSEDELVGRTSETLKGEALRVGKTTVREAGRVASAAVETTFDEVELDAESLKAEAEKAAQRTGEQARKDARRAGGQATSGEGGEEGITAASTPT